ncbi:hypothetical protein DXG01_013965 [Tephrocybe rancida]|nr:hypothetical protein DXG01_013965 [Tephrocybe rancida]
MRQMHAIQLAWRKGIEWLDLHVIEGSPTASAARRYATFIRWNEETEIPGASTHSSTADFATLLASDTMMNGSLVDMMFSHLSDRVERDETVETLVIIETLRFMHEISKAKTAGYYNQPSSPFLCRLEERIDSGQQEVLIFPAHLESQQHWLTFKIDFSTREICYGDSLAHKSMPQPKTMIQKLQYWLKRWFRHQFTDLGDALEHGEQDDFTDCRILSVNTAANEVFHDQPLWTPARKTIERIDWFVTLCRAHVADVNEDMQRTHYLVDFEPALDSPLILPHPDSNPIESDVNEPQDAFCDNMDVDEPGNLDGSVPTLNSAPKLKGCAEKQQDEYPVHPVFSGEARSGLEDDPIKRGGSGETSKSSKGKKRPLEATEPNNDDQPKVPSVQVGNRTAVTAVRGHLDAGKEHWSKGPGLEESKHLGAKNYLDRTGAFGGGAHSVTVIAKEMIYGKKYSRLSPARKKHIKTAQRHKWRWTNDHRNGCVFSVKCTKSAGPSAPATVNEKRDPQPCQHCRSLLSNQQFQNALRVPCPPDHHYKYLNDEYRNKDLAGLFGQCVGLRELIESDDLQESPMIKYVKGIMSGKYPSDDVFGALLQALVLKRDKEEHRVGMQGFRYPENLVEWVHILFTHSRQAYLAVQEFLPLPQPRTLEIQRAKQPRFPLGIGPRTFELAVAALKQLDYNAAFLSVLSEAPTAVEGGWKISGDDWTFFKLLTDNKPKIIEAVKALQKATQGKNAEVNSLD